MPDEDVRWYPSKVDWWIVPILWLSPMAAIVVTVSLAVYGHSYEWMIGAAIAVVVFGIYFGLVFPMRYGVGDTQLVVRFGVCRQRVALADISEVTPTHNPLSSPALS